ncbi:MAG: DUF547 domain-containing protein [Candidatus Omnitrophica bacterium]|nr:DUF547 domain-containing protein [Candidatus Omnitrophota bacterium]
MYSMKCFIGVCVLLCSVLSPVYAHDMLYTDWEILLKTCVQDGDINYSLLKENESLLYTFINTIALVSYEHYQTFSDKEKLAFWINTHNAFSLSLVLKNPLAESFKDVDNGPQGKFFTVFGRTVSLNDVKHTYIRSRFHDERIHFALAAPARGFPQVRNEAYLDAYLDLLLEDDVVRFIIREENVQINHEEKKIYLSKLFKWFGVDFIKRYGIRSGMLQKFSASERAVLNFLGSHLKDQKKFIMSGDFTIVYRDFDWTMNRGGKQ